VRRHFISVYRFFASKLPRVAEDLTQRTFLGCTESRQRIDPQRGFRGYLFGIARRVLVDQLREHYHPRDQTWALDERSILEMTGADPEVGVARGEREALLLETMQELPLDHQITLELHYWENMSLEEVAAATGVARGTVKSRLSRARKLLEQRLHKKALRRELGSATLRDLAGWSKSLGDALARRMQRQ
jgi:RNA polymerase sigma factor (sigma-70 family)